MKNFKKGFTLIELLIVIVILGILAVGVISAINPAKRIGQANDTKLKNDLSQIVTALQSYYTINGFYPPAGTYAANLVSNGDLTVFPTGTFSYLTNPATCTVATATCNARIYVTLSQPKVAASPAFCWRSSTGTIVETTVALCTP